MPLFGHVAVDNLPDRSFKEILKDRNNLREAIEEAMPNLAAQLDFSRAKYIGPDFVLPDWRERESDILVLGFGFACRRQPTHRSCS